MRLHRDPARPTTVPDRDRHGVRQPRPRLDPAAPRPTTARSRCRDVTSGRACFGLWGPRARDILAPLTRDDVSDAAFPYLTARQITVGRVPVLALRVTYVGELGWELYAADRVRAGAVGHAVGGRPASTASSPAATGRSTRSGSRRATASGRATSPRTRRRSRRVSGSRSRLDKGVDFIGREALVAAKAAGPRKRLRCLVLDDPRSVALGNEPVRVDGDDRRPGDDAAATGSRSSARSPMPTCRPDRAAIGTRGEVEVFGEWVGFEVVARAALRPGRRADPIVSDSTPAAFGPDWSASCAAATADELGAGWPSPWPAATRPTTIALAALPARPRGHRPSPTGRS